MVGVGRIIFSLAGIVAAIEKLFVARLLIVLDLNLLID